MMRGEQVITDSEGNETRLLFTNRALGEAESELGKPVLAILQALSENKAGIAEIAKLLRAGMEAARRDSKTPGKVTNLNDAYAVMDAAGFAGVVRAVAEGVTAVLLPDAEQSEKN